MIDSSDTELARDLVQRIRMVGGSNAIVSTIHLTVQRLKVCHDGCNKISVLVLEVIPQDGTAGYQLCLLDNVLVNRSW